ncbi:hypothetical protein ACP4OV_027351 [Aristida adscensionis]
MTHSLGDDLVREILLRLPSLATLARAACACPAWRRAVAASPAFRRRFRALHPAPLLLGVFGNPHRDGLPVFSPALHHRDRDALAAVRGGDFCFVSLLKAAVDNDEGGGVPLRWSVSDCRDGYLVLINWERGLVVVANPLSPVCPDYIALPFEDMVAGHCGRRRPFSLDVHLLSSDEDSTLSSSSSSFRLLWLCHDDCRVRAAVFSSETRRWRVLPWVEVAARMPPHDDDTQWLPRATRSGGTVYCPFSDMEHMLALDTAAMYFAVGEAKDGTPCIARDTAIGRIDVLMRRVVDGDGAEEWVMHGGVRYREEDALQEILDVLAISDGFVYLASSEMVLSLCLETMEMEEMFPRVFGGHFYPYFMAWPASLLGSCSALLDDHSANA